jgi:hypothetical protein
MSHARRRTGRPVAKIELPALVGGILEGYTQRRRLWHAGCGSRSAVRRV